MTSLSQFLAETASSFQVAGIESFQADAETLIAF
jgi:hypothetical protein